MEYHHESRVSPKRKFGAMKSPVFLNFLSMEQTKAFQRSMNTKGLNWLRKLEDVLNLDQRKGDKVISLLHSCLECREWNKITSPFGNDTAARWKRLLRECQKHLLKTEDLIRSENSTPGYSPYDASCLVFIVCFVLGHVYGFVLAHIRAIDANAVPSNGALWSHIFQQIISKCTVQNDEKSYSIAFADTIKKDEFKKIHASIKSLLSESGAVLPLHKPRYSSRENAMFCAGLVAGIEYYANIYHGQSSGDSYETKIKRSRSNSTENLQRLDTTKKVRTKNHKKTLKSLKGNTYNSIVSKKNKNKKDVIACPNRKKLPCQSMSAQLDLSIYARNFLSRIDSGTENLPIRLSTNIVTLQFASKLHAMYGAKYVEKFRQIPMNSSDITLGEGFAQCFAHSKEMRVSDYRGISVSLPDLPVLPEDEGYTERSLRWWGIDECQMVPLTGNESSESEADKPSR